MEREKFNDVFEAERENKLSLDVRGNVLTVYFVICAITFAMLSYVLLILKQSRSLTLFNTFRV
ncbi:hypothetical protein WN48_00395 [Eufriesea mexicana]|uniref:Uncharacterized protein n=1 Tax=Eufriesea mexicana TaxID=516756 RepID=A0A310SGY8_9HYME|nr:hypothetical protein WN48_00395 [Eufriesea mexicana]